jgi:flavin reductase (DIM6/NTAB) family NADH-FMN oxidoreductase RutF
LSVSLREGATRPDAEEFRRALGRFASGITIVTTLQDGEAHGMTANAFLSVSLDPPLVLVSLDNASKLHSLVAKSTRYGISVLRENQESLSRTFSSEGVKPCCSGEFEFVWRDDMPLIPDALAHLVCDVVGTYPAGDHTLYVGRVGYLGYASGSPLVFYTGEYGRMDVRLWDHSYIWKPDPWQ